jgi:hypothetical protein
VIEFGAGGTVRLEFGLDADPGAIAALVAVLRAATC